MASRYDIEIREGDTIEEVIRTLSNKPQDCELYTAYQTDSGSVIMCFIVPVE